MCFLQEAQGAAAIDCISDEKLDIYIYDAPQPPQVDEEIKSHMDFLRGNHYAALELPAPQRAYSSCLGGAITDRVVKDNYRRLALRFHPGD